MSRVGVRRPASGFRVGGVALVAAGIALAAACERAGDPAGDAVPAAAAAACSRESLRAALDSIGAASGGRMSLSFLDPAGGERFSLRGDAPVFMSSVVKLPLAVQLLARVDAGELRLSDTVRVGPEQFSIGRTPLTIAHPNGFVMRVDSLLRYAVSESDNTANDALLRYSGGPRRATAQLQRMGVTGIRIDRNYLGYGWDLFGGAARAPDAVLSKSEVDSVRALALGASDATHDSLSAAFAAQPEDRATTNALVDLLARLARRELLSDSSRALLFRFMTRSNNPRSRIVAGLPAGATAAHKTGTWSDWNDVFTSVSDVGLVRTREGEELTLAVMVAEAQAEEATIDSAIARATRAVFADLERCR